MPSLPSFMTDMHTILGFHERARVLVGRKRSITTGYGKEKWHCRNQALTDLLHHSIKKPKTSRYPSLKGTDPKFRRNHRHALHGTAKALVRHHCGSMRSHSLLTSTDHAQPNRRRSRMASVMPRKQLFLYLSTETFASNVPTRPEMS
jgi:hypothetical protein